ncbi:MAG: hypothetical protein CMI89_02695, partial [Pelagibacteraceae bacterium]|nr:hypothetical protein [Pelagibacteraceae bacterium]
MINNLIIFFGANSKLHLLKIFIIFGLAGSLSVILSDPLLELVSIENFISNKFLYWVIRLILIFPIYQWDRFNDRYHLKISPTSGSDFDLMCIT